MRKSFLEMGIVYITIKTKWPFVSVEYKWTSYFWRHIFKMMIVPKGWLVVKLRPFSVHYVPNLDYYKIYLQELRWIPDTVSSESP